MNSIEVIAPSELFIVRLECIRIPRLAGEVETNVSSLRCQLRNPPRAVRSGVVGFDQRSCVARFATPSHRIP